MHGTPPRSPTTSIHSPTATPVCYCYSISHARVPPTLAIFITFPLNLSLSIARYEGYSQPGEHSIVMSKISPANNNMQRALAASPCSEPHWVVVVDVIIIRPPRGQEELVSLFQSSTISRGGFVFMDRPTISTFLLAWTRQYIPATLFLCIPLYTIIYPYNVYHAC